MNSLLPKVLHPVGGKPMIQHEIDTVRALCPSRILVVVGPGQDAVVQAVAPYDTALQPVPLGTAHAVRCAWDTVTDQSGDVLILLGDTPLVPRETLESLLSRHHAADQPEITVLAMRLENPTGYGRVVLSCDGQVERIVEELDASPAQRAITLVNSGMMVVRGERLSAWFSQVGNNNAKGEYYLPDLVEIVRAHGFLCAYVEGDPADLRGVNDPLQLAEAEARFQDRMR